MSKMASEEKYLLGIEKEMKSLSKLFFRKKSLNLNKIKFYCIFNNIKSRDEIPDCYNCKFNESNDMEARCSSKSREIKYSMVLEWLDWDKINYHKLILGWETPTLTTHYYQFYACDKWKKK